MKRKITSSVWSVQLEIVIELNRFEAKRIGCVSISNLVEYCF